MTGTNSGGRSDSKKESENEFYILVDLPDNVTTTAVTLVGNVSGTFSINCVALLTAEELDEAIKKVLIFVHQDIRAIDNCKWEVMK